MNVELNRKLAEWAEFKKYQHLEWVEWIAPDGEGNVARPDFTLSLDACFKWLVPPLGNKHAYSFWQFDEGMWLCQIEKDRDGVVVEARAETPALALCKAILKLIEEDTSA